MQYNITKGFLSLTLKPRWVHPLNFREQDKEIMDAAILLARREGSDLTNLIREALKEYTTKFQYEKGQKLDQFICDLGLTSPVNKVLTRDELKVWLDPDLINLA
ncbi:MAG: hypothetical protein OK457_00390, partial [Thaumarchaeota archaeon]|nr:hypothetical protein [Nitrososphaerota archaeon]